jgi:hypothetical protein
MDPIFLLILLGGFYYGALRGTQDASAATRRLFNGGHGGGGRSGGRAVRGQGGHRRYVATGHGRGAGLGRAVARGTATTWHGANVVRREFANGWRRGWPEGKERARERFGHGHVATPVAMATPDRPSWRDRWRRKPAATTTPPQPVPVDPDADPPEHVELRPPGDRWKKPPTLVVVPEPNGKTPHTDQQTKEPPPVTTLNERRIEVHSMDDYEKQLQTDINRSVHEVEEAQAATERAEQDVQHNEHTTAVLRELQVDPATLGELKAIGDAEQARQKAQTAVLQAAEAVRAANERALEGVRKRHGAMKDAATKDMADKNFYLGG